MDKMLFKVDEAARLIGLGRSTTYEMVASGELPVVRIGRAVRVPARALEEWIARHTEQQAETNAGPRDGRSPRERCGRISRNRRTALNRRGGKHRE